MGKEKMGRGEVAEEGEAKPGDGQGGADVGVMEETP